MHGFSMHELLMALSVLHPQVQELGKESVQLQVVHPSSADLIAAKQAEIGMLWEGLKHKVHKHTCFIYSYMHWDSNE